MRKFSGWLEDQHIYIIYTYIYSIFRITLRCVRYWSDIAYPSQCCILLYTHVCVHLLNCLFTYKLKNMVWCFKRLFVPMIMTHHHVLFLATWVGERTKWLFPSNSTTLKLQLLQSSHLLVGLIISKFGYLILETSPLQPCKNWGKYRVTRTTCRWERHPSWLFSWTLWYLGSCNVGWVVPPPKNGAFKPSVARNFWVYLYWITKLWNVDKIWLNLFLNTTLHGPTPAPQDEWTHTLKMEKRHQLSSCQISTWVSRWDEFFPGMIHISMGDLLRARAKFLPQLAEYISQGKLVGGLVGLEHVWKIWWKHPSSSCSEDWPEF